MLFVLCVLFALASRASAAPYVVTNYIHVSVKTIKGSTDEYGYTLSDVKYTYTDKVVQATPISPIATITGTTDYADVTVLNLVVDSTLRSSYSKIDYLNYDTTYISTIFLIPITYIPDVTCTGQNWIYTSNVPVDLPAIVTLPAATLSTSATTYYRQHYKPTAYTSVYGILNVSDIASTYLASASSYNRPQPMTNCYTPSITCKVPTITGEVPRCTTTWVWEYPTHDRHNHTNWDGYYDDYDYEDHWLRDIILISVLCPVGWCLIWLVVGFLESWLSFKGLMLGKHRKRGLPLAWCCISCLFLCWSGPTYKAKSVEEQTRLAELWKEMTAWKKFKLWIKWGFRWKYPVDILGEAPEVAKRALRQGCI